MAETKRRVSIRDRILLAAVGLAVRAYAWFRGLKDTAFRETLSSRYYRVPLSDQVGLLSRLKGGPRFWIHAASLGEFQGVKPVLRALRDAYPDGAFIVTTTSDTGQKAAQESGLADAVLYAPLDIWSVNKRALSIIRPDVVLIFETELWPGLLLLLEANRVPVYLVNGRISDRTASQYERARFIFQKPLRSIRKVFAQTELDASRFVSLGCESDSVVVAGSTKYDQPQVSLTPDEVLQIRNDFHLPDADVLFTVGSVRPGEEELLIDAVVALQRKFQRVGVIIAPRHEVRFEPVAQLLRDREVRFCRRSESLKSGLPQAGDSIDVVLLDTFGELSKAYAASDFAFVGGTFVPIGGHNPVEPVLCGAAVLVGPHIANVRDAVATLRSEGALFQLNSAPELQRQIELLCSDGMLLFSARENARRISARYSGLSQRIVDVIGAELSSKNNLPANPGGERSLTAVDRTGSRL